MRALIGALLEQRLHDVEVGGLLQLHFLRLREARARLPPRVDRGPERRDAVVLRERCSDWRRSRCSSIATSNWPLMSAISSGVVLSPADFLLMSAPASSSAVAAST